MPAKSGRQYRYMQMMAHSPEKSRMGGPSPAMAKKIIEGTSKKKKSKYSKVPPQYLSKQSKTRKMNHPELRGRIKNA